MEQKTLTIIILSILITAIVVGGVVYLLQSSSFAKERQQMQSQIDNLVNQVNQLLSDDDDNGDDPTADWQTYRNNEYGFEIKYSDLWNADEDTKYGIISLTSKARFLEDESESLVYGISVVGKENSRKLSFKEFITEGLSEDVINNFEYTEKTVGNYKILKTESLPSRSGTENVFFTKNDISYIQFSFGPSITTPGFQEHRDSFNQILSTFKFTD